VFDSSLLRLALSGSTLFLFFISAPLTFAAPKRLVVGFGRAHPITYKDENGQAAGFAVDVLTEAARREGIGLVWIPTASSAVADEMLAAGKIDLMAAGMISPERREKFHVSEPWWFDELTLLTRKNTERPVTRLGLSPIYSFLARGAYPNATLIPDRFGTASVAAVCSGRADGALITHGDLHDIFLNRPKECAEAGVELQSGDTGITIELAVISQRADSAVAERLRRRISEMASGGELVQFAAKHPPAATSGALRLADRVREESRARVWTILAMVLAPALAWIVFAYARERRRERQAGQPRLADSEGGASRSSRYVVSAAAALAAVTIRYLLVPVCGYTVPWIMQSFAVAAAAQYAGIGGGLLATALAALASGFVYSPPRIWGILPSQSNDIFGLGVFVALGVSLSVFGERFISAGRRRQVAEEGERAQRRLVEEVRSAHDRLRTEHALLKATEQALQESQQRFALALKAGRGGSFDWDAKSNVNVWSEELLDLYGFKAGEFGGSSDAWIECLVPEDRKAGVEAIRKSLETGSFELEFRIRRRDTGEIQWMYGRADVYFDEAGQPARMVGINVDITGRKLAEERLRESESFYRQTLESIPGMVFTTRPDGYCDYQSQQWVDYTGVPMEEHVGDGWNKLLHPDDRPRAFAAWRGAVEERAPYNLEYRVRRFDGTYEWFKVIGRPIRDQAGRIVRWFGVALNIEELKRAEDGLRQALELRKLALEAAHLGAWDYRPGTGEVFWDERSQAIFGASGTNRLDYSDAIARIHPDDRPATDKTFQQAFGGLDGGAYHTEFRVVWPDGSIRWVAGHGQVFFENQSGEMRPVRFVGVNMDITERKQAEERLREAHKFESIGLLAGGVAHDFNNLLAVIIGRASIALEECSSCDHSKAILSAAESAARLTKQLLAYAGKDPFVSRQIDLSALVSRLRRLLEASVPKRVELVFDLAGGLPPVEQDAGRMEQIVMNLVINAGEAIPPQTAGRIEIATGCAEITAEAARRQSRYNAAPGEYAWLEVRDNGSGMDEATLSRIFDPFFSTKFLGRGLGLAAVDGILRSSKGFLEVRSSAGAGATFRVYLPVSGTAQVEEIAQPTRSPIQGHGLTVLVVDDEEPVRSLASMVLRRRGFSVLEAVDGRHALQVLEESPSLPSLAVVDHAMPVMGGDQLIPILAKKYPGIKILVSSGYPAEQAGYSGQDAAVAGFLPKPYTAGALTDKLREILGL
jgi:PAS domain S-box-containing protein